MFKHTVFVPETLREKEVGQTGIGATQKGAPYEEFNSHVHEFVGHLRRVHLELQVYKAMLRQSLGMSTGVTGLQRNWMPR